MWCQRVAHSYHGLGLEFSEPGLVAHAGCACRSLRPSVQISQMNRLSTLATTHPPTGEPVQDALLPLQAQNSSKAASDPTARDGTRTDQLMAKGQALASTVGLTFAKRELRELVKEHPQGDRVLGQTFLPDELVHQIPVAPHPGLELGLRGDVVADRETRSVVLPVNRCSR